MSYKKFPSEESDNLIQVLLEVRCLWYGGWAESLKTYKSNTKAVYGRTLMWQLQCFGLKLYVVKKSQITEDLRCESASVRQHVTIVFAANLAYMCCRRVLLKAGSISNTLTSDSEALVKFLCLGDVRSSLVDEIWIKSHKVRSLENDPAPSVWLPLMDHQRLRHRIHYMLLQFYVSPYGAKAVTSAFAL